MSKEECALYICLYHTGFPPEVPQKFYLYLVVAAAIFPLLPSFLIGSSCQPLSRGYYSEQNGVFWKERDWVLRVTWQASWAMQRYWRGSGGKLHLPEGSFEKIEPFFNEAYLFIYFCLGCGLLTARSWGCIARFVYQTWLFHQCFHQPSVFPELMGIFT